MESTISSGSGIALPPLPRLDHGLQPLRSAGAEIDVDDGGVPDESGRLAFVDLLAVMHDEDAGRQLDQEAHHMLDDDDGDAELAQLPDHAHDVIDLPG